MRAAIERVEATHVLHLAGLQTPTCRANPILGATVNVIGTLAIFEAAVALKDQVQRVVYASSAAVHGPAEGEASGPLGDEVRLAPLTHYGAYKVCNELNARVYWLDQGITSVGLRPWTVYGVGRDFGMTSEPTKAIKSVAADRPYRISYGGLQDLQYVGDVADAFLRALSAPFEGADAFNIRGAVVPIETFAATLREVAPARPSSSRTATASSPSPPTSTTPAWKPGSARSRERPSATGSPRPSSDFGPCAIEGRLDLSDLE